MATFSGSISTFSGMNIVANGAGYPKTLLQIQHRDTNSFSKFHHGTALALRRKLSFHGRSATTPILRVGKNYELDRNDDNHTEPFWLSKIQTAVWSIRSLFLFLAEQPSQLRYIEWPSFQSTHLGPVVAAGPKAGSRYGSSDAFLHLKTAMLTLVLVALLIVALSSVDSALSYLLAFASRRKTWVWK